MEKVKGFFLKVGQFFVKVFTKSKIWVLANKIPAIIIAASSVVVITLAIALPVGISAANRNSDDSEPSTSTSIDPSSTSGQTSGSQTTSGGFIPSSGTTSGQPTSGGQTSGGKSSSEDSSSSGKSSGSQASSSSGSSSASIHTHTFNKDVWEKDKSSHWHPATCGHDVKDSEAAHTFGEWTIISETIERRTCGVCGYYEEKPHVHTFASTWSKDKTSHWHASTCGHDVKDAEAAHTFSEWAEDPSDDTQDIRSCSVCGYEETREHEHVYASAWSHDSQYHWHAATCSHTDEEDEYGYHVYPTDDEYRIGTVAGEYSVYKQVCDCGLITYRVHFLDSDSSAYLIVISFVKPTEEKTGSVTFYPENALLPATTLTLPKLGDNRVVNDGYSIYVDRAYNLSTKGKQCYASINPDAFNFYVDSTDNADLAKALSLDPDWKFEISDETYAKSRKVTGGVWYTEPWYYAAGEYRLTYQEGGYEAIEIATISSHTDWDSYDQPYDNTDDEEYEYVDGFSYFYFQEDASCLSEIDDLYLRQKVVEYLFETEDGCIIDHHSYGSTYIAKYCGMQSYVIAEYDSDSSKMVVVVDLLYGKLEKGDTIYYHTEHNGDGSIKNTSTVKSATVSSIVEFTGSGPGSSKNTIYADGKQYILFLSGTDLSSSTEGRFYNEEYITYFSSTGSTQLNHLYDVIYN